MIRIYNTDYFDAQSDPITTPNPLVGNLTVRIISTVSELSESDPTIPVTWAQARVDNPTQSLHLCFDDGSVWDCH